MRTFRIRRHSLPPRIVLAVNAGSYVADLRGAHARASLETQKRLNARGGDNRRPPVRAARRRLVPLNVGRPPGSSARPLRNVRRRARTATPGLGWARSLAQRDAAAHGGGRAKWLCSDVPLPPMGPGRSDRRGTVHGTSARHVTGSRSSPQLELSALSPQLPPPLTTSTSPASRVANCGLSADSSSCGEEREPSRAMQTCASRSGGGPLCCRRRRLAGVRDVERQLHDHHRELRRLLREAGAYALRRHRARRRTFRDRLALLPGGRPTLDGASRLLAAWTGGRRLSPRPRV